jgi:hypothetical protein
MYYEQSNRLGIGKAHAELRPNRGRTHDLQDQQVEKSTTRPNNYHSSPVAEPQSIDLIHRRVAVGLLVVRSWEFPVAVGLQWLGAENVRYDGRVIIAPYHMVIDISKE